VHQKWGWPEPYIHAVYEHRLVKSLQKLPYIHLIYIVLANPNQKWQQPCLHAGMSTSCVGLNRLKIYPPHICGTHHELCVPCASPLSLCA